MSAAIHNLIIYQGSSRRFKLTIMSGGLPVDLTGSIIRSQIRQDYNSADKLEYTIDTTEGSVGIVWLSLTDAQTALLNPDFVYVYDIEYVDSLGFVRRIVMGSITIVPEVTKAEVVV